MIELSSSTVDWLLDERNPVVRAITLERVLGRRSEAELMAAREGISASPWVRRLMRGQHPEGWWVNPKNCYQPRGEATAWRLQLLAELGMDGADERIDRACERFLTQNAMPDGGFACGVHRKRYSEECLTGHMLYTLVVFGREGDQSSRAAFDWLLERQLPDGGWNCRPNQTHSSFISSLGAVKALAVMKSASAGPPLARAVEFLLQHRLFRSHTTGKPIRKFWPPLIQFPAHYAHDLLHPLRALVLAGARADTRLDEPLDLLEARATASGRWPVDVAPAALRLEPPGRASQWVTAWALAVLKHFGRLDLPDH